jgi:DNA polymerase (family 10)
MDNYSIADNFSLLSKLMDIHGDNSFKAKSYASAAFNIEKLPVQLSELSAEKIFALKGIGEATGKKIIEQLETNQLQILNEYILKTPPGIIEMLSIKGIGPKKIATIWKKLEIESLGELLYACNENRLTLYKGFGEKSQRNIKESIEFYLGTLGSYLFQQIEPYATIIDQNLKKNFPEKKFILTGSFRKQSEIIEKLEWVSTIDFEEIYSYFIENNFEVIEETEEYISFKGKENVTIGFILTDENNLYQQLFLSSCSEEFATAWNKQFPFKKKQYFSEEEIFEEHQTHFIPAYLRETVAIIDRAKSNALPVNIQPTDIKGIIHSHSKWSDGLNSIEEMAKAAIAKGLEYLVISDHSKSAFYANGLYEERIKAQHGEINELNKKLSPFKIFKSIESDILNDGSLDYSSDVLASFDIVIASVHSNLKMSEEKAMMRLMNAIENPFTNILGHMTGRLLLSRNGYPVDHKKIIEACAANNVVIELNAHPRRLDIDWRWIDYALEKNVLISINPDAHSTDGFNDCRYGVLVAQKTGLTKEKNLSSFSLQEFDKFVQQQQSKRK